MAENVIRVLIIDDHAVVRQGLRLMFETTDDIVVAGEAANANEAMARMRDDGYDLVTLDVHLPDRSGLELLRMIRAERPQLRVLVFSMYAEDAYALRALQLGAAGYLNKNVSTEVLVAAIRKIAAGGRFITHAVADRLADAVAGDPDRAPHERLSEREFEVLRFIVAGKSLVEAASEMHLSPKTVTAYRTRILEKTGFGSNADLVRYAYERRLFA